MKIKKFGFATIILIASFFKTLIAQQQQYTYEVDLQNVSDDRVKVVCMVPKLDTGTIEFIFPNVIPGSYAFKEYGRYIEEFTAYDESENKLKIKRADNYNFLIVDANKIQRIEYFVNDSWEEKDGKNFIFQPGGTNIEAGKNFVINNYGFFGYIDGKKSIPFDIKFLKPDTLKGYSYLKINSKNSKTDFLKAANYDELADNPIMYCAPQDASFKIGNTEVNICLYAEQKKVTAQQLVQVVKPVAEALQTFFKTLPVDKYLFMFYLADPTKVSMPKGRGLGSGFGALEHNHCSFYFMPESSSFTATKGMLTNVCAHEFLHILTPLNVHSKEIEDFNFRKPIMSQHLWMYEGVTEYFSHLALLQDSLITMKDFLKEIQDKMVQSDQFGSFSMTSMSKNVVKKKNQERYLSVYSRGALLAMMLDILIIDKSNGRNSLKKVMMQLAQKYGPSKPFDDTELFSEIELLTDPEIGFFFKEHIIGDKPIDYKTYFNLLGYEYNSSYKRDTYYFGRFGIRYFEESKKFVFENVQSNLLGIVDGDVLIAIEDKKVTTESFNSLIEKYFSDNHLGGKVAVKVIRNGRERILEAYPRKGTKTYLNYLAPLKNPDAQRMNNLSKFLGKP